jgi:integrase/recombinase XerD
MKRSSFVGHLLILYHILDSSFNSSVTHLKAAITKYQVMIEKPVKLHFMRLNNLLPYYFDQVDILRIFNVCNNIKHLCMLKVLFFGCLRSGELCNLDVPDYESNSLTLRLLFL